MLQAIGLGSGLILAGLVVPCGNDTLTDFSMPASSGGDRFDDDRSPIKSLRERAGAASNGRWREARLLDEFMPDRGDAGRSRDMQTTWQAFCLERFELVKAALDSGRTAPEIAYQLGELVHTYFRPRGVTLTGQELRRLVVELLEPNKTPAARAEAKVAPPPTPKPPPAPEPPGSLVTFKGGEPIRPASGLGDTEPAKPAPTVSDATFTPPPSLLVTVPPRETVSLDRLLARTLELARPRLAVTAGRVPRDEALRAIDAAIDEVLRDERDTAAPEVRERVVLLAFSEVCGLGLIDRLWADRTVRAVLVNGPKSVFVERVGGVGPAPEVFRDQAHLLEIVGRIVDRPAQGVAERQLRDGTTVTVIFPPAAPDGPVLTLRRPEPGNATLGRLIATEVLDRRSADLLRVAIRSRLRVLVVGTVGSGKTALLAAIARDLEADTRLVTLARHRAFGWEAKSKVELVASQQVPYATLLAAAERLRPEVLLLDSLQRPEAESAAALLARGAQGALMACEPMALVPALMRLSDLTVRLDRGRDGTFQAISFTDADGAPVFVPRNERMRDPTFAEKVRAAGYGDALATLLR
jgi:Flp pilus assembly CpaF family ATPase